MTSLLLPMLATQAKPFDSEDYLFEIKWDRRWRPVKVVIAGGSGGVREPITRCAIPN